MLLSKISSSTLHQSPFALAYLQCCSNNSPLSYIIKFSLSLQDFSHKHTYMSLFLPFFKTHAHVRAHTHIYILYLLLIVFPQLAAATFVLEQNSSEKLYCLQVLYHFFLNLLLWGSLSCQLHQICSHQAMLLDLYYSISSQATCQLDLLVVFGTRDHPALDPLSSLLHFQDIRLSQLSTYLGSVINPVSACIFLKILFNLVVLKNTMHILLTLFILALSPKL